MTCREVGWDGGDSSMKEQVQKLLKTKGYQYSTKNSIQRCLMLNGQV
jgi:hypothetical protein